MTMPDEYAEYQQPAPVPVEAPPPFTPVKQWSWSTDKVLWIAGAVAALGFAVWFLMSYTGARARAIAAEAVGGDQS